MKPSALLSSLPRLLLSAAIFIATPQASAQKPLETGTWNGPPIGFWTSTIKQLEAGQPSNWDCKIVGGTIDVNFPHNGALVPAYFTAEIGDGNAVTILPLLPIAVSNLNLSGLSSLILADGSNFYLQDTGAAGMVNSAGLITMNNLGGVLDTDLSIDGQVTFTGGGTVRLGGIGNVVSGNPAFNLNSTLRIDDHVFEGAGAIGSESLSIRNLATGIIRANLALQTLEIDPGANNNVINEGLMEAVDGGTLRLKQTAVSNVGGTISAGTGSQVELQEVTVTGGDFTGGGVVRGTSSVTLEGPISNQGTYAVANGTITQLDGSLDNTGEVTIAAGSFLMKTPSTFSGGGTVTLGVPLEGGISTLGAVFSSGATLDNTDNLIQGGGNILVPLTNQNTVRANEPSAPLRILSDATNQAILEATDGATLNIRDGTVGNTGATVRATASTLLVDGGGSVEGGSVTIDGGSRLELSNGSVTGGSVANQSGGVISSLQFRTNRLSGTVTNPAGAMIVLENASGLIFDDNGSYQNSGTIEFNGEGAFAGFNNTALLLDGTVTLQGGGAVEMSNSSSNVILTNDGNSGVLVNLDHTIRGSGQIGRNVTTLTNHSVIEAMHAPSAEPGSGILTVDPGSATMTNTGTMKATGGGTLQLRDGNYENPGGLIEAGSGSLVALESEANILGGRIATAGGTVEVRSTSLFDGTGGIEVDAMLDVTPLGGLRLVGSVTNRQKLTVQGAGRIVIDGPVTLSGGGEINLSAASGRIISFPGSIPGDTLINVDNRITGTGTILFVPLQNGGTLAPGNSPGTLVTGSITQTAGSVLEIELLGDAPGESDVLQVSGTMTLGGTLRVLALPGANIPSGTVFTFLTSGGISGSFDAIDIPLNGSGQPLFSLAQIGTSLQLTALEDVRIPLPYSDWAEREKLTGANNGTDDDPNGDGVPNLAAYFLGVPALGPTNGSPITITPGSGGGFSLTFQSPAHVTGVEVGSELSPDLSPGFWEPGPAPAVSDSTDDSVSYVLTVPPFGDSRFARLTFSFEVTP